jgi:hypothetical protein
MQKLYKNKLLHIKYIQNFLQYKFIEAIFLIKIFWKKLNKKLDEKWSKILETNFGYRKIENMTDTRVFEKDGNKNSKQKSYMIFLIVGIKIQNRDGIR